MNHDPARRRQALRKGREKGCSIYVPLESMPSAFTVPGDPAPRYRVWKGPRDTVIVRFYRTT